MKFEVIAEKQRLVMVKLVHTLVWAVMASASLHILYVGITDVDSRLLPFSVGLLIAETAVLAFNRWTCPLTPLAERFTEDRQANFDIYLPLIIAKYNKQIFGTIFVVGLLLVIF